LFGVGKPAPALVVPRVGGGSIDLAALRGKPVWVNFMATWCPSCQDELPLMSGFSARYADQGLQVIAIDVREDEAAVAAFMKGMKVTFSAGLDGDGKAQDDWGALALPIHYWIDRDGIVRYGALGGIGPDVMATGLQKILPGVTVTP
jgi:thiol-disulfide isomerase/thioredoxin